MKPTPSVNGISIVIPVSGRLELVKKLLISLKNARNRTEFPSEVWVLDNSPSNVRESMCELVESFGFFYRKGSDNLSEKRNQGYQFSNYEIVLFLDSDVIVDSEILNNHLNSYQDDSIGGSLGIVEFIGNENLIWKAIQRTHITDCFLIPRFQDFTNWGPTANISFRRHVLEKVGGFSILFEKPGGEDVDLGFRIEDLGYKIICTSDAIAYHTKTTWSSLKQVFIRFFYYGQGDALLIRRHPERSVWDMPTPATLFFFIFVFYFCIMILTQMPLFFIMPAIWLVGTFSVQSLFSLNVQKERLDIKNILLEFLMLSFFFELDFARIIGSIRHKEIRALYRRVVFFDTQLQIDWPAASRSLNSSLLVFFITLIFSTFLF